MNEITPNEKTSTTQAKSQKKANWLQWVIVLCFAGIGFLFAILMTRIMDAAAANGATDGQVMLLWIGLMVSMYAVLFLHIVLHEGGHLIFGLLTGYRFVSFRVGSLMLLKNEQGYCLRWMRLGGTGGQCLLDPPEMMDGKMPNVLYNLGGCLMNLLVGVVCLMAAFLCPADSVGRALLLLSAIVGVIYALINGLPLAGEMANDGRNALELNKNPEALNALRIQLVINKLNSQGVRLKDMPEEYFVWPSEESRQSSLIAAVAVLCANRLLDEHRFDECAARLDEMLDGDMEKLPGMYRKLLLVDRVFLHLLNDETETAVTLMNREQKQFMKTMKGQLLIHRTDYAYALLAEKDITMAEKQLKTFDKVAKNYPHPQEVEAERELIALVQAAHHEKNG